MTYRHTQIGWAMILILGVVILLLAWTASWSGGQPIVFAVLGLMVVCLILFISQTVVVDEMRLEVRVGPGLIRRGSTWPTSSRWNGCGCLGGRSPTGSGCRSTAGVSSGGSRDRTPWI